MLMPGTQKQVKILSLSLIAQWFKQYLLERSCIQEIKEEVQDLTTVT